MTTNSFDMASHMDFGLNQLLPMVAGYAHSSGHPPQAALVASLTTPPNTSGASRTVVIWS